MSDAMPGTPERKGESLRANAIRGGSFLFGRQVISAGLKLIGVLLISRVLGPEKYGSYVAAFGVYQYTLSLGQAGLGICLLRHPGEVPEANYRTATTLFLGMAILVMGLVDAFNGPISRYVGVPDFSIISFVLMAALPFQLLVIPPQIRLERSLNYRSVAAVELGGQFVYYLFAIPLVLGHFGPVALAISWVVQQFFTMVVAYALTRTIPRFGWDTQIAKDLLGYSTLYSLANWTWQLRSLVNPLIVAPAMGAYTAGIIGMTIGILEMLSIIKTIAWRLSVVVLGRFQEDRERLRLAISQGMELQTLSVGAIVLGFSWLGHWIIPMIFGARWLPLLAVYPFVALSYLTNAPFNMHTATMSVLHKNQRLILFHAVHVLLFAGVAWFLIPRVGMIGYGFGELAAIPAYFLLHRLTVREVGMPEYRLTALWWTAAAIGLFWRELGAWAIAVPFVALAMPLSLRRLRSYYDMIFRRRAAADSIPASG